MVGFPGHFCRPPRLQRFSGHSERRSLCRLPFGAVCDPRSYGRLLEDRFGGGVGVELGHGFFGEVAAFGDGKTARRPCDHGRRRRTAPKPAH